MGACNQAGAGGGNRGVGWEKGGGIQIAAPLYELREQVVKLITEQ